MNIYLRATGNWSGNVWSTSDSGPAIPDLVPSSSDDVYINTNNTVTLTANTAAKSVTHTNGTLSLASYSLDLTFNLNSTGSTARTINMGSGHLTVNGSEASGLVFSGTNLTFNAGTSLITFNATNYSTGSLGAYFTTGGKTFNDVRINLGSSTFSRIVTITGASTFNTLDIRSANSAAHTVNLQTSSNALFVAKFIAIGSSSSNKLTFTGDGGIVPSVTGATSYGQFLNMDGVWGFGWTGPPDDGPNYIGSNSTDNTSSWNLNDPPKISTLVDPLTTAPSSNSNWVVGGDGVTSITTGLGGGGYSVSEDDFGAQTLLYSSDSYDLSSSALVFEIPTWASNNTSTRFGVAPVKPTDNKLGFGFWGNPASGASMFYGSSLTTAESSPSGSRFFKVENTTGNTIVSSISSDGSSWTTVRTDTVDDITLYKSVRISTMGTPNGRVIPIGYVNPSFATEISKTQSATARISNTRSVAQTAKARIATTNTKTQTAISRIAKQVTRTQSSTSRIVNLVTKTQTATARITQPFSTLVDYFNTGSQDTSKWDPASNYGTLSYAGNQFTISHPLGYIGYGGTVSKYRYSIVGSYSQVEVVSAGNQSLASWEVYPLQLTQDTNNNLKFLIAGGSLIAIRRNAGSQAVVATTAYNSTNHRWLRFRESAGVIYWDYSSDGLTWSNLSSYTPTFQLTYLTQEFSAGCWASEASATSAIFDNFNVQPTVVSKAQSSIARIAVINSRSQSAIASIAATNSSTQQSTASIINSSSAGTWLFGFNQTSFNGLPYNLTTASTTQLATAAITLTLTNTQSAISRIAIGVTSQQVSTARIAMGGSLTQTVTASIVKSYAKTQTATATIQQTFAKEQTATARVVPSSYLTQDAKARIAVVTSRTQPATASIGRTSISTQTAKAFIVKSYDKTQSATAYVTESSYFTQNAKAAIIANYTKTQTATAYIGTPYNTPTTDGGDEKYGVATIQNGDYDIAAIDESNIYGVE